MRGWLLLDLLVGLHVGIMILILEGVYKTLSYTCLRVLGLHWTGVSNRVMLREVS